MRASPVSCSIRCTRLRALEDEHGFPLGQVHAVERQVGAAQLERRAVRDELARPLAGAFCERSDDHEVARRVSHGRRSVR